MPLVISKYDSGILVLDQNRWWQEQYLSLVLWCKVQRSEVISFESKYAMNRHCFSQTRKPLCLGLYPVGNCCNVSKIYRDLMHGFFSNHFHLSVFNSLLLPTIEYRLHEIPIIVISHESWALGIHSTFPIWLQCSLNQPASHGLQL